jgi:hypothetical protein
VGEPSDPDDAQADYAHSAGAFGEKAKI